LTPARIQRSRAKGARLPDNTVCVDRSTPWGNPFVVGNDGTRAECVDLYRKLLTGYVCLSAAAEPKAQEAARRHVIDHIEELRGKNLACWCRGEPCHADVLLRIANLPIRRGAT
jgi:hypothetical protein